MVATAMQLRFDRRATLMQLVLDARKWLSGRVAVVATALA